MKYLKIKRYKFSTIKSTLISLINSTLSLHKIINYKKIFNYFDDLWYFSKKTIRYFNPKKINIINIVSKIKIKGNRFLFFHLPASIIFFAFLYILIPKFYTYENSEIEKIICKNYNVKCIVKGKIGYNLFPTPRLKIKNLIINIPTGNKKILSSGDVSLKLSFKNLLAKDKHKIKNIIISDFESIINLKKLNNYNNIFQSKIDYVPIAFTEGKISLYDEKNYIASITDVDLVINLFKSFSQAELNGKFLNDNIIINFINKIDDEPNTKIEFKMKNLNFYTKISFLYLNKIINNGKFLARKDKNKISGIFNYKSDEITILKSNLTNTFIDGKLIGKIRILPFFDFNLDLDLNSINFTRLYNYFLTLDQNEQKKLLKINNKINGKLNLSAGKVYSKHNLIKSFESRLKFYNGNIKIDQFLFNLGKLGAGDILGTFNNDIKSSNFKFESNIFVDNKKKFLSKFGIYNKDDSLSDLFIQGNFDLGNIRLSLHEISDEKKFTTEDVNFIESEFNDLMLEKGFYNLFNFKKFKVFLKSARGEKN